LKTRSLVGSF